LARPVDYLQQEYLGRKPVQEVSGPMSITSSDLATDEKGVPRAAYSATETAKKLGVSEASIWRAIKRGQLKAIKFGGRTLITAGSIQRALREAA
jgi:excisionase family DNA binding protein